MYYKYAINNDDGERREVPLSQRNRATHYVSKFVLCFTKYGS